ncbi:hypothetical protein [Streptomyces sp. NBC_00576]|uniref:hypothetical protein n=1 Tax=Streptomyces sp. NBC_00576 TaxID=2903665 RepID=UPI002E81F487|nr:hypothetical protein [Streptomyces sp. NBC_00576]WUB77704.1 hypothetical protein OG734_47610 [Streptomyces sp. NBC_00576]
MRHLPRSKRAVTTHVNPDISTSPDEGPKVLAVGRFQRPTCDNCGGFKAAKVTIGSRLVTIHCSECVPASTAGLDDVMDDVERQDNEQGPEAEDLFTAGRAA